jgi:hypothetical protein
MCYRDMGSGRSISRLHAQLVRQAAESRQNQGKTPMPPTTSRYMLEEWSACFAWQERLRREQAAAEAARRAEMIRQTEALAREQALLMSTVGTGALTLVGLVLRTVVDPATGALRQRVPVRELPALMMAGAKLLALATGMPTTIVETGDSTQLERVLREADPQTREEVLKGMRAALGWLERRHPEQS